MNYKYYMNIIKTLRDLLLYKRPVNVTKISKNEKSEIEDIVLIETAVDIYINSEPLVNIICLPKDLEELTVGFLFSIGVIDSLEDIKKINTNELEEKVDVELSKDYDLDRLNENLVSRVIDTTCGIPSPWRNIIKDTLNESKSELLKNQNTTISTEVIFNSIKEMQKHTPLYRETGGCHGAAAFDYDGNLISAKEDIGRHNAIDKVIGDLLIKEYGFKDIFLISTGRLTGDAVLKAVRAKIPIIASLSAAIESGIRLAFGYGVTLIGFVRGKKMNIYTYPNRIKI